MLLPAFAATEFTETEKADIRTCKHPLKAPIDVNICPTQPRLVTRTWPRPPVLPAKLHQPTRRKVRVIACGNATEIRRISLGEGAKRKLSDSASTREDAKRAKMEE